jgi:hypothetical protein
MVEKIITKDKISISLTMKFLFPTNIKQGRKTTVAYCSRGM